MVEKNPVNLLKEIQKITKCNLIIFTTYSFDPFFFDHMLLRKLRENNPQADIIVLVDQAHLNLENATSATGIKYSLVSLPSTFHPKLFIFCSDRGNTAFIGSHNVTLTGFTQNLELSCKITDDKISKECLLYIRNVLGQFFEPNHKWLEKISNSIKQENKISSKQPDTYFIQNIETPILDQALEILKSKQAVIKEITIVAPFFSSVYQIVKKLRQTTNIKKVNLCVQLNNHNLEIDDVNELRYVNFMKVCTKRKRPLHCKIILFKGQKTSFLLVGSPNFTKAALLKASQNQGNYETALLIRKNDAELKKIFAELNLKKVGKKEIRDSKREEEQNEGTKDLLITLFFAEYDPDHLTVDLKTSNNISNLKLCFEKPNGKLEVYAQPFKIDANQKRIKIPLIDGFPTGSIIWFSRDEKQISNKVAVAIPQIFKPIDITADTFSKISSMIDSSKNIGDLLHIMIKLFPLEIEEATEFSRPESKELTSLSLPSGDKSYGSRVLDLIEQILKLPRVKRNLKENKSDKKSAPKPLSAIEKRSLKERIFKINRKLAKVVEQTKLCDDNTEPSYCIFILLSLKICEKVSSMLEVEKEIRETFEATVSNSLRMFEKLWRKHGVSGSTINLLTILLYLEEKDFKIKSSIMNEILAQFEIKPTNLQSLIHNLEIKLKEFSKLENSTSLKVTAKQLDYYSVRIIDFLWRQPEDLLWKSLNNGRILVEDLAFECFPIINRNEIPFDLLFKGVLGNSWKLDQLKARYNTISPVITEGYPTFKISPQEKLKILRITCQKLTENIFPTSNKVENGQFGGLYLSRKLDETIGKCVMDALFESSPKNEIFVNFGKLFTKIEPTLLKEKI